MTYILLGNAEIIFGLCLLFFAINDIINYFYFRVSKQFIEKSLTCVVQQEKSGYCFYVESQGMNWGCFNYQINPTLQLDDEIVPLGGRNRILYQLAVYSWQLCVFTTSKRVGYINHSAFRRNRLTLYTSYTLLECTIVVQTGRIAFCHPGYD